MYKYGRLLQQVRCACSGSSSATLECMRAGQDVGHAGQGVRRVEQDVGRAAQDVGRAGHDSEHAR
jgi:hypothetical protein